MARARAGGGTLEHGEVGEILLKAVCAEIEKAKVKLATPCIIEFSLDLSFTSVYSHFLFVIDDISLQKVGVFFVR